MAALGQAPTKHYPAETSKLRGCQERWDEGEASWMHRAEDFKRHSQGLASAESVPDMPHNAPSPGHYYYRCLCFNI